MFLDGPQISKNIKRVVLGHEVGIYQRATGLCCNKNIIITYIRQNTVGSSARLLDGALRYHAPKSAFLEVYY